MLKPLVAALALTITGVSIDLPSKRMGDGKSTPNMQDRGDRRVYLEDVNQRAMARYRAMGHDAKLLHILFNPNGDAAMVVVRLDGRIWGMFYMMRNGQWAMDRTEFVAQ